jgi:nucleotide-binding universal stress UspA family protein
MITSILVPLDGSAFGEHALPLANSLACRAGAELHLAHVHLPVPPMTFSSVTLVDALDLPRRQDEQAYFADVSRRLAGAANTPTRMKTALLDGDVTASTRWRRASATRAAR